VSEIFLNIGRTKISFSKKSGGSEEFQNSLKDETHSTLQMMFKDPAVSPDNRTGVLNELVGRAWAKLDKDGKKELTDLLGKFKKSMLSPDELEKLLTLLSIDPEEVRLAATGTPSAPAVSTASTARKPAPESPGSMTYDAIYAELKESATATERRKSLIDELGIRQCSDMPEGENRNKLVVLLIRHRERTLNSKDCKTLAWYLGISADQLAPQIQRAG
jgi:hypothetical protein